MGDDQIMKEKQGVEDNQIMKEKQWMEEYPEGKKAEAAETKAENPLGTAGIGRLMTKFALPSIVAMLVSAVYNIIDQLFIGRYVGPLGNAATNVAFPLAMCCTGIALLFGIGGASSFNLAMGKKEEKEAAHYAGNSITMLACCGVVLMAVTLLFLTPMLRFFGSPDNVLGYARTYVGITAFGFPFLILTIGGGHLIRADGKPNMAMICNLSGAVINTILDAIFMIGFGMGMAGAALATITGQIFSGCLALYYLKHYKTVKLQRKHLRIRWKYVSHVMSLGTASCFNQLAMMVVQIVLNNSLTYYGALSDYGASIPLACSGIVMKVNQVFFSVIIGISQGTQPIESFNYGAEKYDRVRKAYCLAIFAGGILSVLAFIMFQTVPRQIISLFGKGDKGYYQFGVQYFRIFLFFTYVNFLQPITSTFFTSIGKPYKGIFLSLTRQILFLLPLLLLLPMWMGIDGILYAGPVADLLAAVVTVVMAWWEFRLIKRKEREQT